MREWIATKDISDGKFSIRRGMSVPWKYCGALTMNWMRTKFGKDAFVPRAQFRGELLNPGNSDPEIKTENKRLKIELKETRAANEELVRKNESLAAELRILQKREA